MEPACGGQHQGSRGHRQQQADGATPEDNSGGPHDAPLHKDHNTSVGDGPAPTANANEEEKEGNL